MKNIIENVAVIGSSGAIGQSFVKNLDRNKDVKIIFNFSRTKQKFLSKKILSSKIDFNDENSIKEASILSSKPKPLDLVVVATGTLHGKYYGPEKSLKEISQRKFTELFLVNTIGPSLIAKYFLPRLNKKRTSIFSVLSARVGSISDNYLGGWYSYRASKAALNMVIKTASIESTGLNKNSVVVALHPGTVDSKLSYPFQKSVKKEKIFSSEFSSQKLLNVLSKLKNNDSGKIFSWDGNEILP